MARPAALLDGAGGGESLQSPGLSGEVLAGVVPRFEEALFSGDDKAALARLQVDDEPLEPVGGGEHRLGMAGQHGRLAQFGDGEDHDRERAGNEEGEQTAGDDCPAGQPSPEDVRCGHGRLHL